MNKKEILEFLKLTQSFDTYPNINDIRSVTVNAFFKQIENLYLSAILSINLNDLEFLKLNLSNDIEENFIPAIIYNFEGFIKDAFFIKFFILVENHINQIAEFYEKPNSLIKDKTSIIKTFENLTNIKKCKIFADLIESDKQLFNFYCYLRNTIHRIGFQSKSDKILIINDKDSIIINFETKIELLKDKPNNINTSSLLLINEQILKLIIKINSFIPKEDFIEHILVKSGYNN